MCRIKNCIQGHVSSAHGLRAQGIRIVRMQCFTASLNRMWPAHLASISSGTSAAATPLTGWRSICDTLRSGARGKRIAVLEGHKGRLFCQKTHVPCFRASRCSNPNAKAPRAQPFEFQSLHSYAPLSREEQTLLLSPCLVSCLEAFEVWTPGWSAMESEIQALLHVQGFDQGSVRFGCFGVA